MYKRQASGYLLSWKRPSCWCINAVRLHRSLRASKRLLLTLPRGLSRPSSACVYVYSVFPLLTGQSYDQHLNMVLGDVEETVTTVEVDEDTFEEIVRVRNVKGIAYLCRVRGGASSFEVENKEDI